MTPLGPALLLLAAAVQSPASDSMRLLALRLPESELVVETRARPLVVREAISQALARNQLDVAHHLAEAYAEGWRDSFFVREVARFAAWPADRRAAKVWADSVRRAGVAAYGRDGPRTAITIWRRSLVRAVAIPDTAGWAAVLGNIGAGFLEDGRLDSAESYLLRSRALARAIGDVRVEANAVGSLAGLSEDRGDLAAAREQYVTALALRERIGDTRGTAADFNNLGLLAQRIGDLEQARRQFDTALAINRREGRDEVAATNMLNLAGLASLAGDFARAEELYRDALATWRAHGQWADAADALHGIGQLELRRGDYPAARAALTEAFGIYTRTGPLAHAVSTQRDLASALAAAGDLQGAVDQLRRAQQRAESTSVPLSDRAGLSLARADLAVQLNAFADAERSYARAEFLFRQAGVPAGEAEAKQGRGSLLMERGSYARAQELFEASLRTEALTGQQRAAALTRLWVGRAAAARGDTVTARRQLARSATDLSRLDDPVGAAAASGELAALQASAGLLSPAESLYRVAVSQLGDRLAPEVAWRLHAGLGLVLRTRGARDEAAHELRAALAEVDRPRRSLALAERRAGYLADKWDVYAQLALTERERGLVGAAFEASERMRAREMVELLAQGRVAAPSDTAADLVTREQDLRRRIAELSQDLEGAAASAETQRGPDFVSGGATREALHRAQSAYADLLLEMRERAPAHATLVADDAPHWQDVAQQLAPDEAMIEYLVSDSGSIAFVIDRDSLAVVDLGVSRHQLAQLVTLGRGALESRGAAGADSLWRGVLRRLQQYLIAPLADAGLLADKTRLVIVPHAELHYVPFAALLDDAHRYLIEHYEVSETPSASVWLALGRRPAGHGAGVLAFAPRPDVLPASRREVAAIARLAGADVRTGGAASEAAFRREAPTRRVLHLATNGVLNKQNPLFSFIELAPGDGSDDDGRLEVHEVFGLTLAADLVVLSACQTGLGSGSLADVPAGDDWVGLTRAFLHAGAAHVAATLWPVDDWATAALMERFYAAYQVDDDPVRALAVAQRALLADATTARPFYWAGFVVVGGSRNRD